MRIFLIMLMAFVISGLTGCGPAQSPLADVSGKVSFAGEPLDSGDIIFEVPGHRQAAGKIAQGRIVDVTTYNPGDGAPVGRARIAIYSATPLPPKAVLTPENPEKWQAAGVSPMTAPSLIPDRYNDLRSSELAWDIKPGSNEVLLELKE